MCGKQMEHNERMIKMNSNVWSNNFMPPKDIFDEDEQGKTFAPFICW